MLSVITMRGKMKLAGMDAGYGGKSIRSCPYRVEHLREPWITGWRYGHKLREEEIIAGTHKDLLSK